MTATDTCPVDLEEGLERTGHDREFYREILLMFADESPGQIEQLESGLAEQDLERIRQVSHSIKGAAANLAAARIRQAAAELEQIARAGESDRLRGALDALKSRIGDLDEFVKQF